METVQGADNWATTSVKIKIVIPITTKTVKKNASTSCGWFQFFSLIRFQILRNKKLPKKCVPNSKIIFHNLTYADRIVYASYLPRPRPRT